MNKFTNDDIKNMVVEIAEQVYEMNNFDLTANSELEPIISTMRYENELIISEVISGLLDFIG